MFEGKEDQLNFKPFIMAEYDYRNPNCKEIKSGDVLKLHNDEIYLVGDVNALLGACDCCQAVNVENIKGIARIENLFK